MITKVDTTNIAELQKNYKPSLYIRYYDVIVDYLVKKYNISNIHMVPKIDKVIITSAISYKKHGLDFLQKIYNCLYLITGQKAVYTLASRSIAQFKIYKGCYLGAKVCLTNKFYMYEFIERLTHIYLPAIKNFEGIPTRNLTGATLNIGIKDAQIIPEVAKYMGMDTFGFTITFILKTGVLKKEILLDLLNLLDIPVYDK